MSLQNICDVSVIICAYTDKRWDDLIAAVESLRLQTLKPFEIILVIDHNPELLDRVREHFPSEVLVVPNSGPRGLSGARNSGILASNGEIVAFLDDDADAAPEWLEFLCNKFESEKVLGVGGKVLPAWPGKKVNWFPSEFLWVIGCTYKGLPEELAEVRNVLGGCMSMRREIFSVVGGFRYGIGRIGTIPLGCEETELCIRARQKWPDRIFLYDPKSEAHHHIPSNRLNVSYFVSRCYAEGISKSYITQIIGRGDGLSSERSYTLRVLPMGVLSGLKDGLKGDFAGFARAGLIVLGFSATVWGYINGKFMLLRGAGEKFDADVKPL